MLLSFRDFMTLYDNWNGWLKVNNNKLECIVYGKTSEVIEQRKDLYDKKVIAFGFYDGELTVRLVA